MIHIVQCCGDDVVEEIRVGKVPGWKLHTLDKYHAATML